VRGALALGGAVTGGSRLSDVDRAIARSFRTWCAATLCWAGFGSTPVLAGELAYGAGYSLAYDSNINRVPSGATPEFTQTLLGGFAYQERTTNLNARLLAQVERRDYLRQTYTQDKSFFVEGAGVWTILPKQFAWSVEDAARQLRVDIAAPDTPSNRTNVNSLSTGPDFTLRFDPTNTAAIGARYGRFDTGIGVGDNNRHSANARLLHSVSSQTTLSANYEATRVDFKDPALAKILREDRFLGYAMRAPPSSMTIDAGAARVLREGAGELKSRLARIAAAYQLNSTSTLQLSLADQVSDAGSDLRESGRKVHKQKAFRNGQSYRPGCVDRGRVDGSNTRNATEQDRKHDSVEDNSNLRRITDARQKHHEGNDRRCWQRPQDFDDRP